MLQNYKKMFFNEKYREFLYLILYNSLLLSVSTLLDRFNMLFDS